MMLFVCRTPVGMDKGQVDTRIPGGHSIRSGTSWANLGGFVGQAKFDRIFKQCLKIEDTHGYPQIAIFIGHYPPKYGVFYFQTNPIEQYTA